MDLTNGALEKSLKENRYLDENGNPLGLMEIIRLEREINKLKKVDLLEELSKAWRVPNTNVILMGSNSAAQFFEAMKNFENEKHRLY
jgi:hypothetical protein